MSNSTWVVSVIACGLLVSCGKDRNATPTDQPATKTAPAPAPAALVVPPLGVESPRRLNYLYGDGAAAYDKAAAAYKANPRDWATVRSQSEAALGKDPHHLDAQHLLAAALAHDGDYTGAAPHLLEALAGDWLTFGPTLSSDADLTGLLASPLGQQVRAAAATIEKDFRSAAAAGLWLVGRRSTFKVPAKPGAQYVTSRGELYAYDLAAKRYLRLTKTDHTVAAFVRAPSGKEVALIGYDKVELPADASGKAVDKAAPPLLARAYVLTIDPATFELLGKRTTLPKARQLSVGYGPGEQLLVSAAPAAGRWGLGAESWLSIDRSTGKTAKTQGAPLTNHVAITFEDGEAESPRAGVVLPSEDAEVASMTTPAGVEVRIPETGKASRRSISAAPDGAHLAFATATDPCSADSAPSLYVVDAKSGALKHVLTGKSRFPTTWIDNNVLAYEDHEGSVRLWDAATGRETQRLAEKAGLALAFLAISPAPLCKTAPPLAETAPASEGAADGAGEPVVAPTP
jgi:hypothetical protein